MGLVIGAARGDLFLPEGSQQVRTCMSSRSRCYILAVRLQYSMRMRKLKSAWIPIFSMAERFINPYECLIQGSAWFKEGIGRA